MEYEIALRDAEARASFVMDHGRFGPPGVQGGGDGAPNTVTVWRNGAPYTPEHLSKEQDIPLGPGDHVTVGTPGGGGFGDPLVRDPVLVAQDVALGLYTVDQAADLFGVEIGDDGQVDPAGTAARRAAQRAG